MKMEHTCLQVENIQKKTGAMKYTYKYLIL